MTRNFGQNCRITVKMIQNININFPIHQNISMHNHPLLIIFDILPTWFLDTALTTRGEFRCGSLLVLRCLCEVNRPINVITMSVFDFSDTSTSMAQRNMQKKIVRKKKLIELIKITYTCLRSFCSAEHTYMP